MDPVPGGWAAKQQDVKHARSSSLRRLMRSFCPLERNALVLGVFGTALLILGGAANADSEHNANSAALARNWFTTTGPTVKAIQVACHRFAAAKTSLCRSALEGYDVEAERNSDGSFSVRFREHGRTAEKDLSQFDIPGALVMRRVPRLENN